MNVGVVLAGGVGNRFGSETPKQYQFINGKEVIWFAIDALQSSATIDEIVVVTSEEFRESISKKYRVKTVRGGKTRNQSLKCALDFVHNHFECDNVIILEAARPMITAQIVDGYVTKLGEYDSVITGQRIADSLGCFNCATVDRANYYLIQAPEAFRFNALFENFDKDSEITATNQQMPKDAKLFINFDFVTNHKITYLEDLKYCESLMSVRTNE